MKKVTLKFKDGTSFTTLVKNDVSIDSVKQKAFEIKKKINDAEQIEYIRTIEDKLIEADIFTEDELKIGIGLAGESIETFDKMAKIKYNKDSIYDIIKNESI